MICYLVRHGKDDETVRGGWSQCPQTEDGIQQIELLADRMESLPIQRVYSSDLCRAIQTAQMIADRFGLPVIPLPAFREVNNGDLAGMPNAIALERYPGLFWNQLGWEQSYPNGESPREFHERICRAWVDFSQILLSQDENVVLVTHGGVIHVLLSIMQGKPYRNCEKQRRISHGEVIPLTYQDGIWIELP